MNKIPGFITIFVCVAYFFNELSRKHSETLSNSQFVGVSLMYVSIPIMVIGLIMIIKKSEIRAKDWTFVAGTVVDVKKIKSIFGPKYAIEYEYYVKDICYQNDRYSPTKTSTTLGKLMLNSAFRNGNPSKWKGKRVKVFYNKEDVWDSMLENTKFINFDDLLLPSANVLIILSYVLYILV